MGTPTVPSTPVRRRPRLGLILAAVVVVAVAAFAAVYFLFFSGDSPAPLRLSTPATTAAGASGTTAAGAATTVPAAGTSSVDGTWNVGSGSTAGYRVREKLARLPAQSDAVGRTDAVHGSIQVTRQGGQVVVADGAKFDVDVSTLRSDESQRDRQIRMIGLETNRFPTATFVSTAPITLPAGADSGQPVKAEVTGDLTIHGVTKRVTIPLDAQLADGRIEVVGSLTFPFSDFGMSPPSIAGIVSVTNDATLEFKLLFDKK